MNESTPTFESGTQVQLKSGGPVMTVAVEVNGTVVVDWWSTDLKAFFQQTFKPAQLKVRGDQ